MNCRDCGQPSPTLVCQACFATWEEGLRRGHLSAARGLILELWTESRCFTDVRPDVSREALIKLVRTTDLIANHLMSTVTRTPEEKT